RAAPLTPGTGRHARLTAGARTTGLLWKFCCPPPLFRFRFLIRFRTLGDPQLATRRPRRAGSVPLGIRQVGPTSPGGAAMAVGSCPGPLVWQQYVLGLVAEAEQQALEAHLANCSTCLERLRRVPAEDKLVTDLRGGLTVANEPRDTAV